MNQNGENEHALFASGTAPVDFRRSRRKRAELSDSTNVDRQPPHDLPAEQGVLGCILCSPLECLAQCIEAFKAGSEVFYDLRHAAIYEVALALYDKREGVDVITMQRALREKNQLESVGGVPYLASLPDATPSAANLAHYIEIVRELHVQRRLISTCTDTVARIYDHSGDFQELLDEVERDVHSAIDGAISSPGMVDTRTLVQQTIDVIEAHHQRQNPVFGMATGFPDFDKMTGGLQDGELIVIAARPSCGKTALALNIAEHVSLNLKLPVGVFSLEMTAKALMLRAVCSLARVNIRDVSAGYLAQKDFPKLTTAAGKLSVAQLYIDDTSGLSIMQLRAKARRMHQRYGIKLFVIDYLQLMNAGKRIENRQQEVAAISNGAKDLAKELNVPVIGISQLNREVEKQGNRKPRMSDLRESGAIEQDADLVAMLYREKNEDEETTEERQDAEPINLVIVKQRNGPTGTVPLTFIRGYTRFESAAKIDRKDYPQ